MRGLFYFMITGLFVKSIGVHPKIRGEGHIQLGENITVGDFCWIEAVTHYADQSFRPVLQIGRDISLSDFVHISCVRAITISDGTLIGSKVYIGDHSHGTYSKGLSAEQLNIPPAVRHLGDIAPVRIGRNCWIGDNAVILAGTEIGEGCIIGANSVVRGNFPSFTVIAGSPARVVRELNRC